MALSELWNILAEQPESGSTRNADASWSGTQWTRVFAFKKQYLATVRRHVELDEHDKDGEGYLRDYQITCDVAYAKIAATYSTTPSSADSSTKPLNTPQYFLVWVQDDIPVERLTKYRTKWNHVLVASELDTTGNGPGWYEVRTGTIINNIDEAAKWHWYKDSSQVPNGWRVICDATKPGVDMKMNYRATIREITWCDSYTGAASRARKKMDLVKPAKDFGIGDDKDYWLAVPSQVGPDGPLFKLESLYIHSDKVWDADIYP